MNKINIERAAKEDLARILALQKIAYVSEAELIDDFSIPPLHQTIDEISLEFNEKIFLKVELENEIAGSVRIHVKGDTCHVGKLIVHPDYQNAGVGSELLNAAEKIFPEVKRLELFTGQKSDKNLYLYKKKGYRIFQQKKMSEKLTLVFLEKYNEFPG